MALTPPDRKSLAIVDEILVGLVRRSNWLDPFGQETSTERTRMGNAATAEAPPRTKTQYVVLLAATDADGAKSWQQIGERTYEGNTDVEAIKAATSHLELDHGTFVAVPVRSFKARNIEVKVSRTLSIQ